jgi:hypothetical protein
MLFCSTGAVHLPKRSDCRWPKCADMLQAYLLDSDARNCDTWLTPINFRQAGWPSLDFAIHIRRFLVKCTARLDRGEAHKRRLEAYAVSPTSTGPALAAIPRRCRNLPTPHVMHHMYSTRYTIQCTNISFFRSSLYHTPRCS